MDKIENTHSVQNQKEEASRSTKKDDSGKHENADEGLLCIFPRLSLCVHKKKIQ